MHEIQIKEELARGTEISIINLVELLIKHAHKLRASDIHIDPSPDAVRVRFRIDGVLQDIYTLPRVIHGEIISRIKILTGLRTDEHQAAQDGRFRVTLDNDFAGQVIDIRVSIMPTYYGENTVLRLLADQSETFTLETLGLSKKNFDNIMQALRKPYGMILATGPTGSGKTTTLYTMIKRLNTKEVSILTIEDPIEYAIEGIEQVQVNARTGLTFANGLRSFLRQDPNIIMVGEIRDSETASLAVNTALTGHLLLSTLHTNDAATTLPRLLDMKVEPFLVASTVNIAIGQRLVRRICPHCKTKKQIHKNEYDNLVQILSGRVKPQRIFSYGRGCEQCNNTGYRGRLGIHEVLVVDNEIRETVLRHASASEINKIAIKNGMISMVEDGYLKAKAGLTTIEEVVRIFYE
jgi:type IV pilus assembly protein PilB